MKKVHTKKLVTAAILLSFALVLGYFERFIPLPVPLPGAKLGLSNVVVLFAVEAVGIPSAIAIMLCKVLLSGLMYAGVGGILYGLFGGALALILMLLARCARLFSFPAVSALGGAAHNAGQLLAAVVMLGSATPFYYLPWLLAAGAASGVITGIAAYFLLRAWGRDRKYHPMQ